ncbi:hypothetical protein DDM87_18105 [Vibrio cholerae]|nr:hypothetical protein [Vibrio cholerae]
MDLKNLNINDFTNIEHTYAYTKLPLTYKECIKLQDFYRNYIDKVYSEPSKNSSLPKDLLDACDALAAQHAHYQTKRMSIVMVIVTSLITGILTLLAAVYSEDLTTAISQLLNR